MDEMSVSKVRDLYKTYIAEKWKSLMVQEMVVTEKVITKETFTKEMIDAGANVLRHLNKANFDVQTALWIYRLKSNSWRLVFALSEVEKKRGTAEKLYENTAHPLPNSKQPAPSKFIRYLRYPKPIMA